MSEFMKRFYTVPGLGLDVQPAAILHMVINAVLQGFGLVTGGLVAWGVFG